MLRHRGHSHLSRTATLLRADGQAKLRGGVAVTPDDLLYRFRPRVFAIAAEFGTVRAACRAMGIIPRRITAGSGSWIAAGATPQEVTVRAGTSVSFTLDRAATRRSPGRSGGGPVPSGKGLDYGVR
jgi:hypothetical protein